MITYVYMIICIYIYTYDDDDDDDDDDDVFCQHMLNCWTIITPTKKTG